eukprot:2859123-Pleurochrysis_carterae.AAC.3
MIKADHLRRAVDGLQQQFVASSMAMRLSLRDEGSPCPTPSFIASLPPLPCPRLRCFVPVSLRCSASSTSLAFG